MELYSLMYQEQLCGIFSSQEEAYGWSLTNEFWQGYFLKYNINNFSAFQRASLLEKFILNNKVGN